MTIIYFIIILSVTVFVHELGHFIFAKKLVFMFMNFVLAWGLEYLSLKGKMMKLNMV